MGVGILSHLFGSPIEMTAGNCSTPNNVSIASANKITTNVKIETDPSVSVMYEEYVPLDKTTTNGLSTKPVES